jgi:hypothetical protein
LYQKWGTLRAKLMRQVKSKSNNGKEKDDYCKWYGTTFHASSCRERS